MSMSLGVGCLIDYKEVRVMLARIGAQSSAKELSATPDRWLSMPEAWMEAARSDKHLDEDVNVSIVIFPWPN